MEHRVPGEFCIKGTIFSDDPTGYADGEYWRDNHDDSDVIETTDREGALLRVCLTGMRQPLEDVVFED